MQLSVRNNGWVLKFSPQRHLGMYLSKYLKLGGTWKSSGGAILSNDGELNVPTLDLDTILVKLELETRRWIS